MLLDMTMHTRTVWEFEAVIVLLNGHWPARGLLSGRWPPKPDTPDTVLSTSSLSESPLGDSTALNTVHEVSLTMLDATMARLCKGASSPPQHVTEGQCAR